MKKKIILALIACLFAAGSIINMHLAQNSHAMDVSLADISVMAQADGEHGGGTAYCCPNFFDCEVRNGYLCVTCGGGPCSFWYDWTEDCGLASTCWF